MDNTIGAVAEQTGCAASTIRYYEQIGLVKASSRGGNGYRYYDAATIERLAFVQRARDMGFSIDSVTVLLRLADHPDSPCDEVDELVRGQIEAVRERLAGLRQLEVELVRLQSACEGGHSVDNCGVLSTLSAMS